MNELNRPFVLTGTAADWGAGLAAAILKSHSDQAPVEALSMAALVAACLVGHAADPEAWPQVLRLAADALEQGDRNNPLKAMTDFMIEIQRRSSSLQ